MDWSRCGTRANGVILAINGVILRHKVRSAASGVQHDPPSQFTKLPTAPAPEAIQPWTDSARWSLPTETLTKENDMLTPTTLFSFNPLKQNFGQASCLILKPPGD